MTLVVLGLLVVLLAAWLRHRVTRRRAGLVGRAVSENVAAGAASPADRPRYPVYPRGGRFRRRGL